ncbi:MAG: hypothetical protein QXZ63_06475 [Sulfolobales archaeon]
MIYYVPPAVKLAELSGRGPDNHLVEYVKSLTAKIVVVNLAKAGGMVQSYIRKALHVGALKNLRSSHVHF